ncbi:yippee [Drechmeria coniospora]|uniref:Protein yippee-like n=1 Tax=Drechmeria coniospora TaxID=98403 RepID=A0A151GBU9_DRECN|nr:yippee [Drechmeria coniospora]KYK54580.1 yippee [Drechmeria coniospora]ODA80494.1 hypothetical protein RJ55_03452 [Drechmeria coniospora]
MGLAYNTYLTSNKIYGCKSCKTHLANHEDIISRVCCLSVSSLPLAGLSPSGSGRDPRGSPLKDSINLWEQNFRGQHGKAYLFHNVVNVDAGEPLERNMTTGRHVVRDITCRQCKETVGWKYDKAYENSEKYKEGKFILEAELLCNVA